MDWISWLQTWSTKSTTTAKQETSETKTEEFALKTEVFAYASRLKAKAKPRRLSATCSSSRTVPIRGRTWFDIEPGAQFSQAYPVAKRTGHFFGMDKYLEKMMERLNSGENKMVFGSNMSTLSIGLMMYGRARWQEAEATRKYFNIVLTRQDNKFFISKPSKVIQDAIPLILHFRTMCKFWTISSSTFINLEVQSVYTPQNSAWYWEDKIWAGKERQYSLRLWIPWRRNTKIRMSLIWPNHVLHGTSRRGGKDTRTRCIGSIYSLLNEKD